MNENGQNKGIASELRLLLRRAGEVWQLVPRRHKLALGAASVVMAITSACSTIVPVLLGKLVDTIKSGSDQHLPAATLFRAAGWFLALLAVVYVLREALNVLRRYLAENTITRINRDMQLRLVGHLMKTDLNYLARENIGTIHGRIFRSVDGFIKFLRMGFLDFFPALLTGLFALAASVSKQPLVGLIMLGVVPLSVFLTVRQLMSQKGVRLGLMRVCEELDGALVEQLSSIEYVRAAHTHEQETRRLARATDKRRAMEVHHHFVMSLFGCGKALNEGFFNIVILACSTYLFITGAIPIGDVLTFSVLFLNVMTPLAEIHRVIDEGHESSLRVGELLEMLAEPVDRSFLPALPPPRESAPRTVSARPGSPLIEVEDLGVEYATADGRRVRAVDRVSLCIRHGETIGMAGRSGCGKTTMLKVLLRLTHPTAGAVRLGGVPLEAVTREDIGRLIGYVGQSPFVFAGTVAENIAYGNEGASPDEIIRAAQMAHLHDEILLMPGGYEARVAERGQNLSGGQRQRLAIARILLKQPAILILDEATSALDNISERHVQRSLGLNDYDRTTILVAHRLSTLRDADRIFVFDRGRVVEVGPYDELVHKGGMFTQLVVSAERGVRADGAVPVGDFPQALAGV